MKVYGHVDFNRNKVMNAMILMENGPNFPQDPEVGLMVFKNKILYICVDITDGIPVWAPLTQEINVYMHNQTEAAAVWTIDHNLQTTYPIVQCIGSDNKVILPDEVEIVSNNQVKVYFGVAQTGRASVLIGNTEGNTRPATAYTYDQTTPASTWVVVHNLGYNPIIRVFIGNQEVQPLSIVHDSISQTTVTFSSAQVGYVRCI
jgi:hypothetical protein